jgi:hypothetical protein
MNEPLNASPDIAPEEADVTKAANYASDLTHRDVDPDSWLTADNVSRACERNDPPEQRRGIYPAVKPELPRAYGRRGNLLKSGARFSR